MQKRRKRLLALLLAGAMILNLGGFQIGATEVRAEETQETQEVTGPDEKAGTDNAVGEQNQEEENQVAEQAGDTPKASDTVKFEDKYPTITSIKADRDLSNPIKAGESFNLIFHVVAPEDVKITSFGASYGNNNYQWASVSSTKPGTEGIDLKVSISTNAYASAGKFTLESIAINSEKSGKRQYISYNRGMDGNLSPYSYNDETGMFEFGDLVYGGDADYEITENENADSEAPIINSVKMITSPVSTAGKVEVEVNYTEEGSGVATVYASFSNNAGMSQSFQFNAMPNDDTKGTGKTLVATNTEARQLNETYTLNSLTITDRAGHSTYYNRQGNELVATTVNSIPAISYTVTEEKKAETVLVKGISCTPPKGKEMSDLTPGDAFTVHLQLQNSSQKEQTVDYVNLCYSYGSGQNNYHTNSTCTVPAGGTAVVDIDVQISPFSPKLTANISDMNMTLRNGTSIYYGFDGMGTFFGKARMDGYEIGLDSVAYDGSCNYTITESDKEDVEAPYVKSFKVLNDKVEAPGWLEFALDIDDGNAKARWVQLSLTDKADNNHGDIYCSATLENGHLYYSANKKCYVVEVQLSEDVYTADYELSNISVEDEAGQMRSYSVPWDGSHDVLYDGSRSDKNGLNNITVHIAGKADDGDKQEPILKSITVDKANVKTPGEVTWTIEAEEENGISLINMDYKNDSGKIFNVYAEGDDIKNLGKGKYSFTRHYTESVQDGTYKLESIRLQDGSGRRMMAAYDRNEDTLKKNIEMGDDEIVSYKGEADFTVEKPENSMLIDWDKVKTGKLKLADVLNKANTGDDVTIVADYGVGITREDARVIQEKKLKVTFALSKYEGYYREIIIDGKDITDEMINNIDEDGGMTITRMEIYELENIVDFGNAYDQAGYTFYISENPAGIPYTIRMEVSDKFYNDYKESVIRLSKEKDDKNVILNENIKIDKNHMLEARIENPERNDEYDDRVYRVSTDTVKLADYNLEVEATPKMSSNIVTRGSSFQYEIAVTNSNPVAMKNVSVLGMLTDRDGEVVTDDLLKRLESEDVTVSYSEETGWVIDEIPAGRTIRLIGTYSIEGVENLEKVKFCIGVGSASEDAGEDDMESFGRSDEQILILTDKTATLKGDVNLDGQVDMKDLLHMLRIVSGRISEDELSVETIRNGDVVGNDGTINMSDLKKLLSYISQRITTLE